MSYVVVLANIAGNLPALSAAFEKIEALKEEGYEVEKYYILGDIVGPFPYSREVIDFIDDLLKEGKAKVIRGRLDQIIAESDTHAEGPDYIDRTELPEHLKKALKLTWEELGHDGREFVRDLPVYLVDRIGKNDVFGIYGSPLNPFGGEVLPDQPGSYYDSIMRPVKEYEMLFVSSPRYPFTTMTRYGRIVCPGTLGFPPKRELKESFALVDGETLRVKFIEVDYNKKLVEERIRAKGLPEEIVRILYHGKL
jgi:diadenosine tetraphosphatase ApaH/serine/threonine PP2A family protein phosphatase